MWKPGSQTLEPEPQCGLELGLGVAWSQDFGDLPRHPGTNQSLGLAAHFARPSKEKTWHPDPIAVINIVALRAKSEKPITIKIGDPDDDKEINTTIELSIRHFLVLAARNLKDPDGPPRFLAFKASDYAKQSRKFWALESAEKRSLEKIKILNKDRLKKNRPEEPHTPIYHERGEASREELALDILRGVL